ncbi:MAG TPA: translation initiation factor IF-2 [Dongiaceae bacterium]|jgi:translation initiation factor IF-2|nr:translation initiation factor IF-2 [Dongiaceae bacterium]
MNHDEPRKPLKLGAKGKLEIRRAPEGGSVKQSFSHGRSKTVAVEVKKKRSSQPARAESEAQRQTSSQPAAASDIQHLTESERIQRQKALQSARRDEEKRDDMAEQARRVVERTNLERRESENRRQEASPPASEDAAPPRASIGTTQEAPRREQRPEPVRSQLSARPPVRGERPPMRREERNYGSSSGPRGQSQGTATSRPSGGMRTYGHAGPRPPMAPRPQGQGGPGGVRAPGAGPRGPRPFGPRPQTARPAPTIPLPTKGPARKGQFARDDESEKRKAANRNNHRTQPRAEQERWQGRASVDRLLSDDDMRQRSLAAVRRAREKERRGQQMNGGDQQKIARDVIVPEVITVQELANRMAERGADVIKALMKMGVMVTINQTIDADTAELVVGEFGHRLKRVSEADVEIGIEGGPDEAADLLPRPPVVTVMGHVDHGKTSLLDALRSTDVAVHEAGGITQHIGAYQVTRPNGKKITFIDTPGHAAFSEMRARGANVTDIVVLVVAADDGIKQQTIEAIQHAKAARVPIIVAINKIDKPGADPARVRNELLSQEIVAEELGGDTLTVEVSAKARTNLDRLEEAILLQAEVLDLKANPRRAATGAVIEAKLERGRGAVATMLVQKGTLRVGDILVAGSEWGKVRALVDDHGAQITEGGPAMPVEVLGLQATPLAGETFAVVESEAKARQISEFRKTRSRQKAAAATSRGSLEQMMSKIAGGEIKELPLVIKGDVQGSIEAIVASLKQLGTEEVGVKILHSAVGGINESDVTLARASNGMILGFNVRANPQAREMARRDHVDIRYYSIIYNVVDDIKAALSGMLAPDLREKFLGNAEIREVFNITKVGKVAGCMVSEGVVKRGAKVRLLRDNVVIHEGALKTLKRFKDEVREVQAGFECGMAFENYDNIEKGDTIECFEIEEITRALA